MERGGTDWFMPFPRALALSEKQTAHPRIELGLLTPFLMTITIILSMPPVREVTASYFVFAKQFCKT